MLLSLLYVIHWLEEYIAGFYAADIVGTGILRYASLLNTEMTGFIVFQALFWGFLVLINAFLFFPSFARYIVALGAIASLTELHHIYKAAVTGGYYPGLITALVFPVRIGVLIKSLHNDATNHDQVLVTHA